MTDREDIVIEFSDGHKISYQGTVERMSKEIIELRKQLEGAVGALKKEAPKWDSCSHEYEPNTTMEYFRCDRCGARPLTVATLKQIEALKGSRNEQD